MHMACESVTVAQLQTYSKVLLAVGGMLTLGLSRLVALRCADHCCTWQSTLQHYRTVILRT